MNTELDDSFKSIQRALKVCSILLVASAFLHTPRVIIAIGRVETFWYELMGDAEAPWIFAVSQFLGNYFLFNCIGMLAILICCIIYTKRSVGGGFLYLNLGIYMFFVTLNTFLIDAAQQMMQVPLQMLNNQ